MTEVSVSINGRIYEIGCDQGQEGRVAELAAHIDQRLSQIAKSGAAYNDAHLMVLTALTLADELLEIREGRPAAKTPPPVTAGPSKEEEKGLLQALDLMTKRIDGIAQRLQAA
jgi:cell division protein ZapA